MQSVPRKPTGSSSAADARSAGSVALVQVTPPSTVRLTYALPLADEPNHAMPRFLVMNMTPLGAVVTVETPSERAVNERPPSVLMQIVGTCPGAEVYATSERSGLT